MCNSLPVWEFIIHASYGLPGWAAFKKSNQNTSFAMKLVLTLTALLMSASLAMAAEGDKPKKPEGGKPGEGKRPNPEEIFKKLDANADGSVSKDEFLASPRAKQDPAKAEEHFSHVDKDGDGKLSKEEFVAMAKAKGPGGDRGKGKKPEAQ